MKAELHITVFDCTSHTAALISAGHAQGLHSIQENAWAGGLQPGLVLVRTAVVGGLQTPGASRAPLVTPP